MGRVKCEYNWNDTGRQAWYDASTHETLMATFPIFFYEDFMGSSGGGPFDATTVWNVVDVGDATEAVVADSVNGDFRLHLAATNEAEDAVLYMNDNKNFDVGSGLIFETRINVNVDIGTGVTAVFGMAGDHNLAKDSVTEHAWFRMQASNAVLAESDDTTNDNDDKATGVTAVSGTYNIFRIDFTDISDVKFYIDGARVAASTTFNMENLTAAEQKMQPYFSLDKANGTALGDLDIDYVKIWQDRS